MEIFERTPATAFGGRGLATAERATAFLRTVYGWMCAGLAITTLVAYSIASSPGLVQALVTNHLLFLGLFVAQIALVFFLSARVDRLAPGIATLLFIAYAALTGVTLSVLVLAYTGASIATTFVVTAGMFGALALYGSTTRRSLAGAGQFFFMGLIGLVLASIVGIFWRSPALQFVISVVGVIVFTGLTAWDAQRLKQMALCLRLHGVWGWRRDGLGTGARGRGSEGAEALMLPSLLSVGRSQARSVSRWGSPSRTQGSLRGRL